MKFQEFYGRFACWICHHMVMAVLSCLCCFSISRQTESPDKAVIMINAFLINSGGGLGSSA